jgi:large subunit ribosomal protein L3
MGEKRKVRGILGKKIGMTQVFDERGNVVPVTVVQAGPNTVIGKKSEAGKDGYAAIRLGFDVMREKLAIKPQIGEFKKLNLSPMRHIRELRINEDQLGDFEVGAVLNADVFEVGDYVSISAKGKGKGFAGVMKRHNFSGGHDSHGVAEYFRHGGSVGSNSFPAKVFKGKKMPGHMGNKPLTVENLKIVRVDLENNLLLIHGAVPGHRNAVIFIRNAKKKWKRA